MNAKKCKALRKEVREALGVCLRHETKYKGQWQADDTTLIVDPTCARGIYKALKSK